MTRHRDTEPDAPPAGDDAFGREDEELEDDAKQILDLPTEDEVTGGARWAGDDYDYGDRSLG